LYRKCDEEDVQIVVTEYELYGETDSPTKNVDTDDWRGLSWNNTEVGAYFNNVMEGLVAV